MPSRTYGQYCALAKSLDVVGDRWTLLVVRELLDGPARYGDLLTALAPISTDILANRLRQMETHGLVAKRHLPKPASGAVYDLTADGRALEGIVNAHARWGRRLLGTREPGDVVRPQWLARAVRAFVRDDRAGPPVTLRLVVPEGQVTLTVGPDGIESVGDDAHADVTLRADAETLLAAMDPDRSGGLAATGALEVDGAPDAVRRVGELFG
ncbi:winged helix-turn-helix transcriptional regulator [Mycolicibacterium parafortuitum]|uniref:Transcriptional regulator [Streptomyces bingchenggensis BCW-1] n=1 Tax=Mycolicibacterium parafortuitum TaxID=39692 RepID=A0A375YQP5_MYCPF|nr:helix-turn-helix domain-containing protein [Mycolicibacterium parafortuitum]ORB29364.1 HxlR family transcriptional regulator [Mycolicibacterium parafortuitum]SRX83411.1 transcriptional regulator [Streptomyces bingchenggensis BCW-1] [Mycolicibacterium parafortuitum]